jgi:hypothetical protein
VNWAERRNFWTLLHFHQLFCPKSAPLAGEKKRFQWLLADFKTNELVKAQIF